MPLNDSGVGGRSAIHVFRESDPTWSMVCMLGSWAFSRRRSIPKNQSPPRTSGHCDFSGCVPRLLFILNLLVETRLCPGISLRIMGDFAEYMRFKNIKLHEQFLEQQKAAQGDRGGIFSGVCIFVNGFTKPSHLV